MIFRIPKEARRESTWAAKENIHLSRRTLRASATVSSSDVA